MKPATIAKKLSDELKGRGIRVIAVAEPCRGIIEVWLDGPADSVPSTWHGNKVVRADARQGRVDEMRTPDGSMEKDR